MTKRHKKTTAIDLVVLTAVLAATCMPVSLSAWDHPSHMTTAAIAFADIERMRPDLMERIGLMLMRHPDPAPFWVSASGAPTSKERARRMFIEGARWPDDAKSTTNDRLSWHSARFPIVADDTPQETKDLVAARGGEPIGDALEALELQWAVMKNPEAGADERSLALSWFLHIAGDMHQPMHVTDYFSAEYPTGNAAGSLSYVWDPMQDSATSVHILWDSNSLRSTALEDIDGYAAEFMEKHPRESLPQLAADGGDPDFRSWALEAHQIAVDFAYGSGIEFVKDPDPNMDAEKLVGKMINYVLFGESPLDEAPEVPAEYWAILQEHAHSQIALAGYRIADVIVAAADKLLVERTLTGDVLESMDNVQSRALR